MNNHPLYKLIKNRLAGVSGLSRDDQMGMVERCAVAAVGLMAQDGQLDVKVYTAESFAGGSFPLPNEVYIFQYNYDTKIPFEVNVAGDQKCGYFRNKECARIFAEVLIIRKREEL